jgi:hypothetical protein
MNEIEIKYQAQEYEELYLISNGRKKEIYIS